MVGRGQVDENLESETAEECEKYGPVMVCKIFEFPVGTKNVTDEEAVRIFVQFSDMDSAQRGLLRRFVSTVSWGFACFICFFFRSCQ